MVIITETKLQSSAIQLAINVNIAYGVENDNNFAVSGMGSNSNIDIYYGV